MQRERNIAYGRWQSLRVDAQPVRDHIAALLDAGMSIRGIATTAGLNRKALHTLLRGRPSRGTPPAEFVFRSTAEKLLALEVPELPATVAVDGARVPAVGTQRRLQALIAAGWTQSELARRLDMSVTNFAAFLRRDHVTAARHRDVAALFAELQLRPGTSVRSKQLGARNRWPLPFEWDEDAIDDPDAEPMRARHSSRSSVRERIDQVAHLTAAGWSAAEIADRLDVSIRTVSRDRAASIPLHQREEFSQWPA